MKFEEASDTRKFPTTLAFRCTPRELETLRRRAKKAGCSVSEYVRRRIRDEPSGHAQNVKDLAEFRQHYRTLEELAEEREEIRDLLPAMQALIDAMAVKVQSN